MPPKGYCTEPCPVGKYGITKTRECNECTDKCAECIEICTCKKGNNCREQCIKCEKPLYLDHKGDCVKKCIDGYYHSEKPIKKCKVC